MVRCSGARLTNAQQQRSGWQRKDLLQGQQRIAGHCGPNAQGRLCQGLRDGFAAIENNEPNTPRMQRHREANEGKGGQRGSQK